MTPSGAGNEMRRHAASSRATRAADGFSKRSARETVSDAAFASSGMPASNAKKKVENAPIDRFAVVSTGEEEAPEEGRPSPVHAVQHLGPQDTLEGRQQLAAIEQLVQGDDQAELVLMAWAMGSPRFQCNK